MAEALSPESGSFPKRRPAAVSRLTVPNEPNTADAQFGGPPSCHSDAPPPQQTASRRLRLSKPGLPPAAEPLCYKVVSSLCLLLLLALASVSLYRQKQLVAVLGLERKQHEDEMSLQVAWLSATMSEHDQCKAALKRADADYQAALTSWKVCQAGEKQSSEQVATVAQLQVELDSSRKGLQEATDKLQQSQVELSTALQQQQQTQMQIQVLQQQVQQLQQKGGAAAPMSATQDTAMSAPATDTSSSSSSGSDTPVVIATCAASDISPNDVIRPWCEAAVAAGVPRVMLVSDSTECVEAAKSAGIKVLQHTFQAPSIPGPLAEANLRSYRRYAALQQVLSLGFATVSVEPDVLLLSDPLPLLQQHPTDVAVMSAAWGDEHSAYGYTQPSEAGGAEAAAAGADAATVAAVAPDFHIRGLSTGLLYLKPQQASLQFLDAMMAGLASGQHSEATLLNTLLLSPWHIHTSTSTDTAGSSVTSSITSSESSDTPAVSVSALPLEVPVTVGVLPVSLFTSSEVVFKQDDPQAWLKQQQPIAVQVLNTDARSSQVQEVLQWLQADIQEVIQAIGHMTDSSTTTTTTTTSSTLGEAGGEGASDAAANAASSQDSEPQAAAGDTQPQADLSAAAEADTSIQTQDEQQQQQQAAPLHRVAKRILREVPPPATTNNNKGAPAGDAKQKQHTGDAKQQQKQLPSQQASKQEQQQQKQASSSQPKPKDKPPPAQPAKKPKAPKQQQKVPQKQQQQQPKPQPDKAQQQPQQQQQQQKDSLKQKHRKHVA